MEKIILIWINIIIYRSQSNLILLRYDIDPKDKISKFCVEIIRDSRFTNSIERVSRSSSDEKWRKPIRISTYSQRIRLYTLRFLDISIIIKIFNHPSRWLFSLSLSFSSSSSSLLLCSRLLKTDLSSTSVFTLWSSSEPEDSLHSPSSKI